ncbi:uncharacterized protein N7469_010202 [Penicillium citrinum]|uniref:Oxidoreductase n=2 Tax=Penicillium TaxID=5073 RepID=A0A9W9TH65_PENCI|nr:uncharacterized protein N7469_010202 [Penicillium citrinum]KAJ5221315.1 hypothetical protein N7469_010202 [Penicillium citrinum]KAJ5596282.1 hypothetical protein N7450_002740 [Penicillium hetheringtonii]
MPTLDYNPEKEIPDLSGKSIFITGGTNGIGAESAIHLAKHNPAHIYISGRNSKSADKVIQRIKEKGSSTEATFVEFDLASLSSVKEACEKFLSQAPRLDILICNAGIMAQPPSLTPEGYEIQFGTNHLGHALMIKKFLPLLEKRSNEGETPESSFSAQRHGVSTHVKELPLTMHDDFFVWGRWRRYGQSKLANLLYARELSHRYPGITCVAVHPGVVATGLVGASSFIDRMTIYVAQFGKLLEPHEGAYCQIWAATVPKEKIENGMYYEPVGIPSYSALDRTAKDDRLAERLWEWTEEAIENF